MDVGAGAVAWPLISQMNPDASTLALASTEVDISAIPEGGSLTVNSEGPGQGATFKLELPSGETKPAPN